MEPTIFTNLPVLKLSLTVIGWSIMVQILYASALRMGRIDIYLWIRALVQFSDVILVAALLGYLLLTSEIKGLVFTVSVSFIFVAARIWHAIEMSRSGFKLNRQRQ